MVRSFVATASEGSAIALYMVDVRRVMALPSTMEKEVKAAFKRAGGRVNRSCLFLRKDCGAGPGGRLRVTKATGKYKRSVAFVPRKCVSAHFLQRLDKRESQFIIMTSNAIFLF